MEQLAVFRARQLARFQELAARVSRVPHGVLFCQVWTTNEWRTEAGEPNPVILRTEAQSAVAASSPSVRTYAALSASCGIRAQAMDLLGDCRLKGATRLIEDLEHADLSQHPRDKLPGHDIPACSALFLPIFDPSNPFSRQRGTADVLPSGLLEILVCKSAKMAYNHSDLLNAACEVMGQLKLGVSADATAFNEWSRKLAASSSQTPGPLTPSKASPRNSMSRASSMQLLSSDDSDEILQEKSAAGCEVRYQQLPKVPQTMMSVPESSCIPSSTPRSLMQPTWQLGQLANSMVTQ